MFVSCTRYHGVRGRLLFEGALPSNLTFCVGQSSYQNNSRFGSSPMKSGFTTGNNYSNSAGPQNGSSFPKSSSDVNLNSVHGHVFQPTFNSVASANEGRFSGTNRDSQYGGSHVPHVASELSFSKGNGVTGSLKPPPTSSRWDRHTPTAKGSAQTYPSGQSQPQQPPFPNRGGNPPPTSWGTNQWTEPTPNTGAQQFWDTNTAAPPVSNDMSFYQRGGVKPMMPVGPPGMDQTGQSAGAASAAVPTENHASMPPSFSSRGSSGNMMTDGGVASGAPPPLMQQYYNQSQQQQQPPPQQQQQQPGWPAYQQPSFAPAGPPPAAQAATDPNAAAAAGAGSWVPQWNQPQYYQNY